MKTYGQIAFFYAKKDQCEHTLLYMHCKEIQDPCHRMCSLDTIIYDYEVLDIVHRNQDRSPDRHPQPEGQYRTTVIARLLYRTMRFT